MIEAYGPDVGLRAARKHLGWRVEAMAPRLADPEGLRARLMRLACPEDVWRMLESAAETVSDDSPLSTGDPVASAGLQKGREAA